MVTREAPHRSADAPHILPGGPRGRTHPPSLAGPVPTRRRHAGDSPSPLFPTVRCPWSDSLRRRCERRHQRAGGTDVVGADGAGALRRERPRHRAARHRDGDRPTPDRGGHPGRRRRRARAPRRAAIAARTLRTDRWWLQPLMTVVVLVLFIVYATFRAFQNAHYFAEPYISPFYSPCLTTGLRGRHLPGAVHRADLDLPGALHPGLPAGLPADLLLLPQGLLPVVLAVAAGLRRRRAAPALHRRDPAPADPARTSTGTSSTRRWSST